jgi:hypothetical protein
MRHFRYHIGGLLILVLLSGVGFAALREANDLWDSGIFSLTTGALLVSVLLALHRVETKRAFWVGFALFGWGYFGLTSIPSIEPRLFTTKALAYLDSQVANRPLVVTGAAWGGSGTNPNGNVRIAFSPEGTLVADYNNQGVVTLWNTATGSLLGGWGGTTENFVRIGHSFLTLIAAGLGGRLSRSLSQGRMTVPMPAIPPVSPRNDSPA